ncbi:unnamed protein product [Peronospora destructor]|uniref:Reverse transcriptase domain-containing protein n=1 Tax=Peronospora destructor TaxID=86335 RepID=A0AAV0UF50_9STRA|nr:unnamed protein product [Peronospora destructor]
MALKGFQRFNSCHEHNFVATTLLDQTRRQRRRLYQVWYDLRNAFGSLPQELMWRVLCHLGVEHDFVARCQDIYADSAFVITNAVDGDTDPVRQEQLDDAGVPPAEGVRPCVTAYADDLKVFSDSADGIRWCHGVVTRFLAWTGLRANPTKCASLAVKKDIHGNATRNDDMRLEVYGDPIAHLSLKESYTYLGVGDGLITAGVVAGGEDAEDICLPKGRICAPPPSPAPVSTARLGRAVSMGLWHLLRLPQSTTTEIFYTPTSGGGLGLQSLVEMHQALQVAHAWQMLHSKDPAVAAVALAGQADRKRYRLQEERWRGRDVELARLVLNSQLAASPHAEVLRRNGEIGSLWVDLQRILSTLHLSLTERSDTTSTDPLGLRTRWKGLVDQGKTVRVHGGLGAKFVMMGAGLSDAEHRFGIQARLNQVDTNSVLKRRCLHANHQCRAPSCSSAETLAHVLNHCEPNMDAICQRHDDALKLIGAKIQNALVRAKSTAELRLDHTVPEYTGAALRPDIVLRDVAAKTMVGVAIFSLGLLLFQ